MKTYLVLEQHFGDRQYWAGDKREMREDDAAELVKLGLLVESSGQEGESSGQEGEKAKTDRKNKALASAPENKAQSDADA